MPEETVLIVMSDHGHTPDGIHSMGSFEETSTPLFAYSKKGFANNDDVSYYSYSNESK